MDEQQSSRIEVAITKLTDISANLDKMLGVHEQRLNQQEKQINIIETVVEKRREDIEVKLYDVYDTIKSEDKNILTQLNSMRVESTSQFDKITEKINEIERTIWMYLGGFSVLIFLITYGKGILALLIK
jgi:chromosome segregation ATPase